MCLRAIVTCLKVLLTQKVFESSPAVHYCFASRAFKRSVTTDLKQKLVQTNLYSNDCFNTKLKNSLTVR